MSFDLLEFVQYLIQLKNMTTTELIRKDEKLRKAINITNKQIEELSEKNEEFIKNWWNEQTEESKEYHRQLAKDVGISIHPYFK